MADISLPLLFASALIIRLGLIIYGEWQDNVMLVKYTDIDYNVFTDAAKFVTEGRSPYQRATYRYTPLLAWMLTPNIWLLPSFGKILFCFFDLVAGAIIYSIVNTLTTQKILVTGAVSLWLLNPLTLVVSSRGNAESIMSTLVLATLHQFLKKNYRTGAVLWAISVHLKIYPVIYAVPMYLAMGRQNSKVQLKKSKLIVQEDWYNCFVFLLPNKDRVKFFLTSLATILLLTAGFYYWYGWKFLEETYLYHLTRSDTRHNFSPFFYLLYLTSESPKLQSLLSMMVFIPQALLLVAMAFRYYQDLPFCCFLQTFVFVSFNKVCTSQYFLWYLTLLPIVLPSIKMSLLHACSLAVAWFTGQAVWLYFAYLLEFEGQNTFLQIGMASLLFFGINCVIMMSFIRSHISFMAKKIK